MKPDSKTTFRRRRKLNSLLGLALDGSRLDGVVLRHTGGALQLQQSFSATLTLDPLTAAPELVGREIRNQLDAAGVRERHCVLGVPLKWVLTTHAELPPLPDADAASLLQMEAERGFPYDTATLQIGDSRGPLAGDKKFVLLAGIPNTHIGSLEQVLAAAKLKPVSFALGLTALQPAASDKSEGVLALAVGESHVSLQITNDGGVAALRALEGAIENPNGRPTLLPDHVARESRITLGQLPVELRDSVKRVRVFGPRELAQQIADEMELRFGPAGMKVEVVSAYASSEFGAQLPVEAPVSAAFSLAARALMGQRPAFEFLPPKPTLIEQFIKKYSSGRLQTTGAVVAGIAVIVGGLFLFQQFQLWRLRSQWSGMSAKVADLTHLQDEIQQYKPWYGGMYPTGNSFRSLAIMRQLSLAFPEDGAVTAKTIDIRDDGTVNCSGNARDNTSLLALLKNLQAADGVTRLKVDQIRGKDPMQFSFDFHYDNGGANEN
jgi:Tfp pilus assembly protein PilN